jgi:hypothetical protein
VAKAEWLKFLEPAIIRTETDYLTFDEPTSPQSLALEWLLLDQTSIAAYMESSFAIVLQRYVLAVLYYSTNGPEWKIDYPFLEDTQICDWKTYQLFIGIYRKYTS